MNVIFIAPPAAGKGTQAKLVSNKYQLHHLSTGNLIRDAILKQDSQAKELQETIGKGLFVNDEFILDLISEKLISDKGYIFDGFPRNLHQAVLFDQLLEKLQQSIDYVFYLNVDKDTALKRITGRIVCPNCDKVYHEYFEEMKPKTVGICDECTHQLIKRTDDNLETFNQRYETYIKETTPLIDYYKQQHKLYEINSGINQEVTFNQIVQIIGEK